MKKEIFINGERELREAEIANVRAHLLQENLLRCLYTKEAPSVRLSVEKPLKNVRLILRQMPDPVAVLIDQKERRCVCADDRLPDGFRQLYGQTEPFDLEEGDHLLEPVFGPVDYLYRTESSVSGIYAYEKRSLAAVDLRYLPAAFLMGNFACTKTGTLVPWEETGKIELRQEAKNYVGTAEICMDMELPNEEGWHLLLDPDGAVVTVWIEQECLGVHCFPPYDWEIPKVYRGGVHPVRIEVTESIRPLFDRVEKFNKEQPHWTVLRPCTHAVFGLKEQPHFRKEK